MIKILAHRGYWGGFVEKNSPKAIRSALERGYGFESDVRDYMKQLVISHDIADSTCQKAEEVFRWMQEFENQHTFAVNIKADGLKDLIKGLIETYKISNYFLFDMSVPQMIEFRECGLRYFTRQSEVETEPCLYGEAAGIWIDGFWTDEWITKELLERHFSRGKEVCIVSPDLHGRDDYKLFWEKLKGYGLDAEDMMLCTDHPDEAEEYFNA